MARRVTHYLLLAAVLLGVPFACAWLGDRQEVLEGVCAFPPRTEDWGLDPTKLWNKRRPFSWPVFAAMCAGVLAVIAPLLLRLVRGRGVAETSGPANCRASRFPWFGWAGVVLGAVGWGLAWTRYPWFAPFQPHTYLLVWAAYILVMNALCVKRSGRCLMTAYPGPYAALLPASAAFWWFFEYLNRYVWNWYYQGVDHMNAAEYVFFATFSFATVLPAVTATAEWLNTFRPFSDERLCGLARFDVRRPASVAGLALIASVGLTGIVFCPEFTFPLLWISPLAVFLAVQILRGEATVVDDLRTGDWRRVVRFALAALICGGFWEMWNLHSYAKWVYAVPYVQAFQIFEMPVAGFAGYLPFGLECAAVAAWICPKLIGAYDSRDLKSP
ncbi:MAG TPA: hypothetical protein PKM57_07165 [Kiritimatiellia bacterium]|nr:hypothetical protein [Kiritimatiellia bacterium]HPS07422.1 hypothetical protein [Kiritimatiellia bacterium]